MFSKQALFFRVFAMVLFFVMITASVITFILPETFAGKSIVHFDEKHITESLEHFLIPERDIFRSEHFRNLLVDNLLAKNWSRKPDYTPPLSRADFSKLVENSFKAKATSDSPTIEIDAFASTPQDAAELANAIAETYRLYRLETEKELRTETIRAYEEHLRDTEEKIENCRKKLAERDPVETDGQLEYSKLKRSLEELERYSEIINYKLEKAQTEETFSTRQEHFIVKPAVPNLNPVRPNKTLNLGIGLVLGTLAGTLAGIGAMAVRKR